jgi:hypothetical protein
MLAPVSSPACANFLFRLAVPATVGAGVTSESPRQSWAARAIRGRVCENSTSSALAATILGVALASTAFLSCKSEHEHARKAEAQRVSDAVRAVREAPHNAKSQPLEVLKSLACRHPSTCQTQQVCAQAYSLHQQAVDRSSLLRQNLRDGHAVNDDAVGQLLLLTEKDLDRAKQLMDECLRLETTMLVETR